MLILCTLNYVKIRWKKLNFWKSKYFIEIDQTCINKFVLDRKSPKTVKSQTVPFGWCRAGVSLSWKEPVGHSSHQDDIICCYTSQAPILDKSIALSIELTYFNAISRILTWTEPMCILILDQAFWHFKIRFKRILHEFCRISMCLMYFHVCQLHLPSIPQPHPNRWCCPYFPFQVPTNYVLQNFGLCILARYGILSQFEHHSKNCFEILY
jgi:hypothetical protein